MVSLSVVSLSVLNFVLSNLIYLTKWGDKFTIFIIFYIYVILKILFSSNFRVHNLSFLVIIGNEIWSALVLVMFLFLKCGGFYPWPPPCISFWPNKGPNPSHVKKGKRGLKRILPYKRKSLTFFFCVKRIMLRMIQYWTILHVVTVHKVRKQRVVSPQVWR